jgi:hypothetical protein
VNHPITEPVPTVASPAQELVCASAFCHNLPWFLGQYKKITQKMNLLMWTQWVYHIHRQGGGMHGFGWAIAQVKILLIFFDYFYVNKIFNF